MNRILISHYFPWSPAEVKELRELAAAMTPVGLIAAQLGRTPPAIRAKAKTERIALSDVPAISLAIRTARGPAGLQF
jgi:hypothetical protein